MKILKSIIIFSIGAIVVNMIGKEVGRQAALQELERRGLQNEKTQTLRGAPTKQSLTKNRETTENRIDSPSISITCPASKSTESNYSSVSQNTSSPKTSIPDRDSKFTLLMLPSGLSVEVPKNWQLIDGDKNTIIQTATEAVLNLSDVELPKYGTVNLYRSNSMPKTTYASIAIDAIGSESDPDIIKNASEEEIAALTPIMFRDMQRVFSSQGIEIIEFYEVRREFISGHPVMIIGYKRSGLKGACIVQMTQLLLDGKIIRLTLSYRESEERIWKPIIQYVRKSFKFM